MGIDRPLVAILATAHWGHLELAEHHLADRLTAFADVLFVDPPASRLTVMKRPELRDRLAIGALYSPKPGLHVLVPEVIPGKDRPLLRRVGDLQVRWALRRAADRLGATPTVVLSALPHRNIHSPSRSTRFVYWSKDDHVSGAGLYGLRQSFVEKMETKQARAADAIVACSQPLANHMETRGLSASVIENGCDFDHFSGAPSAPRPMDLGTLGEYAIYVGTLADRIDIELLLGVANSGIDIAVIGGTRRSSHWPEVERLRQAPRIHLLGHRAYDELPAYLGSARIGLLPYRRSPYNDRSSPLKLLEYLASGLPVVSTDIPSAVRLRSDVVSISSDLSSFVHSASAAMARPRTAEDVLQCQTVASLNDWSVRATDFARILELSTH